MGDIAEMMLDGTLDSVTGEYLGEPCGYPRSLSRPETMGQIRDAEKPYGCPECPRNFSTADGRDRHVEAKH